MIEGESNSLSNEGNKDKESTVKGLIEVCEDYLQEDDKEILSEMDLGDAIGYVFGILAEAGEDPEQFLVEKGILKNPQNNK